MRSRSGQVRTLNVDCSTKEWNQVSSCMMRNSKYSQIYCVGNAFLGLRRDVTSLNCGISVAMYGYGYGLVVGV